MFGFHGRYLRIDLTNATAQAQPLPEPVLRRYLGGVGLAVFLLHRESTPGRDPLAPESPLIFSLSSLVGSPLTTSAKFAVAGKSPLTDRFNDSLSSSHFALAAKRTGFDALVVHGSCERPSVLILDESRMRLIPAGDLWGLGVTETQERLSEQLGPEFQAAVIGPAGENQVRYATIGHGRRHAGRGGLGAVMGAKKLKAVAVAGRQMTTLACPEKLVAQARSLSQRSFGPATAKYRELGTVANLLAFNRLATLPTRNFQQGTFEGAEALSREALDETHGLTRQSCAACTIGCEHLYVSSDRPVRLEYESLYSLGSMCGIGDPEAVLRSVGLCNQLGLDTISAGATIAFAMEAAERGLIKEADLRFGNSAVVPRLLEQIARREGLGQLLAEGTRRIAAQLGDKAASFAPQVKGLELPGFEPRSMQTLALGLAVSSRGADQNRSGAYEIDFSPQADRLHGSPEIAQLAVDTEDRAALMDSLILCKFLRGVFTDLYEESAGLLRAVTGWDVTAAELHTSARRIVTAKKLYNIREGWTAQEDTLPPRFLTEGLPVGDGKQATLPRERLQAMIQAYYRARGWCTQGLVPPEMIRALDLQDLVGFNQE